MELVTARVTRHQSAENWAKSDSSEQAMSILEPGAKSCAQLSAPIVDVTKGPKGFLSQKGPIQQAYVEMEEVTSPIKQGTGHTATDGVDLQAQVQDEYKQIKSKGSWKKLARKRGKNKEEEMLVHKTEIGAKRLIKFEASKETHVRPQKRVRVVQPLGIANSLNETAATAG